MMEHTRTHSHKHEEKGKSPMPLASPEMNEGATEVHEAQVKEFIAKLKSLLPKVGADESKVIQIEVLVALSVEGILDLDNLEEKAPMIRALCEMIKFDSDKKETAIAVAKRLLKA